MLFAARKRRDPHAHYVVAPGSRPRVRRGLLRPRRRLVVRSVALTAMLDLLLVLNGFSMQVAQASSI